MSLHHVSEESSKEEIFALLEEQVKTNFRIANRDLERPWGGFLVIDEDDAEKFIKHYFPGLTSEQLSISGKLSPKILVVAPNKKLSWQYHHRRAEIWRVTNGPVAVWTSDDDTEREQKVLDAGESIELRQGERHRLVGLDGWGIVAEIWRHTDENNPSDENDIVRVQDDFGR